MNQLTDKTSNIDPGKPFAVDKLAVLKAKRVIRASRGALQILLGIIFSLFGIIILQSKNFPEYVMGVFCILMGFGFVAGSAWIRRSRKQAGIFIIPEGDEEISKLLPSPKFLMGMISGLIVAIIFPIVAMFLKQKNLSTPENLGKLCLSISYFVFFVFMINDLLQVKMWQPVAMALTFPIAGIVFLMVDHIETGVPWAFLIMGIGAIISGYSLQILWKKWVAERAKIEASEVEMEAGK
ncbi:hypothetical protein ACFL54_05025 [Planctomycetota bacterium]